jgi:hypothetical protein
MGDHEVLSLVHTGEVKERPNLRLPIFYRGLEFAITAPKIELVGDSRGGRYSFTTNGGNTVYTAVPVFCV